MPIYTYRCESCGIQFEKQQKFSDKALTRCPECSEDALRKVYLPVGIVFKGSGFYATDNRSPSGAKRSKDGKSKNGDKSDSEAKSETGDSSESKKSESSTSSEKKKD